MSISTEYFGDRYCVVLGLYGKNPNKQLILYVIHHPGIVFNVTSRIYDIRVLLLVLAVYCKPWTVMMGLL
jgi:hypothetical protein